MAKTINLIDAINKMSSNKEKNIKLIKNFEASNYTSYLFDVVMTDKFSEEKKMLAIETLLEVGALPQVSKSYYDINIISEMIYYKYKEENIIKIIRLVKNKGFDLNTITKRDNPLLYYLIANYNNITPIYKALLDNGYDIFLTKAGLKNIESYILQFKDKIKDYDLFIETYKEDRKRLYNIKYNEYINKLNEKYPNLEYEDYKDYLGNNLLCKVPLDYYDEEIMLDVIKYLLDKGLDPNQENSHGQNYIYRLLNSYHKTDYICKIINLSLKYGLDINHKDKYGNTIIHHMFKNGKTRNIMKIFNILLNNNFDYKTLNNNNDDILYLVLNNTNICDREEFINTYSHLYGKDSYIKDPELRKLGEAKYYKKFINHKYLENYFCLPYNRSAVICGKDNSLKTATINNLSDYHVSTKGKKAFITSMDIIIKNCISIGDIREKLITIFEKSIEEKFTLFIDDFDKIYNFNNSKYDKKQLDIILKHYIEEEELRLVVTINKKNKELLLNPILKNFIEIKIITELYNNKLLLFIDDYIKQVEQDNNIILENDLIIIIKQILSIIINNNYIEDKDNISNVKVVTEIINKLFECKKDIDINNLIYSIRINQYIKEEIKRITIEELSKENNKINIEGMIKKLTK